MPLTSGSVVWDIEDEEELQGDKETYTNVNEAVK
jgi:hypothetical protein